MKRIIAVLLVAIIVFSFTAAGAENYYEYRIHDQYFAPFSPELFGENNVLYHAWGDRDGNVGLDWHLLWYRDGKLFRDFAYSTEKRFNQSIFLPREDNTCGVLVPGRKETRMADLGWDSNEIEPAINYIELYEWTDNGLELQKQIPGDWEWTDIKTTDDGFVTYDPLKGTLSCFDSYGNLLQEIPLTEKIPQTEIMQQMRYGQLVNIAGEISEQCVILFRTEIANARNARYLALCLDHLKEKWTRKYQFSPGIVFPGDGYFYCLERVNDSKTSPVKIIRLDEQGNDLLSRMLSADNLVLGFHVKTSPLTGNLMLYGKAVANSKKIYNVFRMDLDENMNQVSLDVRQIDYYDDYSPSVQMQKDGTLFVHCVGGEEADRLMNVPTVLIPYDVLPVAETHGLQLK